MIQIAIAKQSWRCCWQGCGSRKPKEFKALPALKKHLKQHIKRFRCPHGTCNLAFAREADAERHFRTKHLQGPLFTCPFDDCDSSADGFTRKDKYDEHIRKHDHFRCPFDHCGARVLETKRDQHIELFHTGKDTRQSQQDIFECSFTGCESSTSRFNYSLAKKHLSSIHRLHGWSSFVVARRASTSGPVFSRGHALVLIPVMSSDPTRNYPHRPCTICTGSTAAQATSSSAVWRGWCLSTERYLDATVVMSKMESQAKLWFFHWYAEVWLGCIWPCY